MAKFQGGSMQELIEQFRKLDIDTDKMLAEMVIAGAEVVHSNITAKMPPAFKAALTSDNITLSKVYRTPSDDGINCQAKIEGYFINRNGKKTPAPLVANMIEYGSTDRKYKKASFLRASFTKKQIEEAMLKVQEKYIKGE